MAIGDKILIGPAIKNAQGEIIVTDTPSQLLAKLKSVDGSGSGLDADTVRGVVVSGSVPTGSIFYFPVSNIPVGYLKCNGANLNRTVYSALFTIIGSSYGAGDGTTTFTIPDLRGEFIRCWDDGRGVDVGRTIGSAQAESVKSHTHTIAAIGGDNFADGYIHEHIGAVGALSMAPGEASANFNLSQTVTSGTNSVSTESCPRNVALVACIRYY